MPMGRARREKSTSQLDDDDDGKLYAIITGVCRQQIER